MDTAAAEFTNVEIKDLIVKIVKTGAVKGDTARLLWYLGSAVASGILAALLCGVALLLAGF
jgi:hypothetical protein